MSEKILKGYRCEVHLPDATVLVRKCATRPYEFARCRKTMLPGVITERWGWKLIGMSMTRTGAVNLIGSRAARPGDIDEIFPVIAIPIYKRQILKACGRCKLKGASVEDIPMHGYTERMCQHCYNVAIGNGEIS
jgi:hypothetical protein